MELRLGYKATDWGVIPDDWGANPIGENIDLLTGYPFPSSGYTHTGVRLLRGSNIKRGETDWSVDILQHWPSVTADISKYALDVGDLVIAMDGSLVGRSFAQLGENDLPALLLQRVARIRSKKLDVGYLRAFIGSRWFVEYVDSVKTVTAIPHISPADIRNFTIPLPATLDEQRAIATALSDMDALLDGLDRLIAKKCDIKQAAMQQLLTGKTRLPGFEGEWEHGCLGDVVLSLDAGVSVNSVEQSASGEDKKILKTSAVLNGRFIPSESKSIAAFDIHRVKTTPEKGTLLISRMNTPDLVGEIGYVEDDRPDLFLPDRLWMARFRQGSIGSTRWLSYLLSTARYKILIRAAATGTSGSMKNISKGALLDLPISYPKPDEQLAIATAILDADTEIEALEKRRAKTADLKQAMMQELLTGRTRLI